MNFSTFSNATDSISAEDGCCAYATPAHSFGVALGTDFQIGDRVRIRSGFVDCSDIGKEGRVVRAESHTLYPFYVLLDGQEVAWPVHAYEIEKAEALISAA